MDIGPVCVRSTGRAVRPAGKSQWPCLTTLKIAHEEDLTPAAAMPISQNPSPENSPRIRPSGAGNGFSLQRPCATHYLESGIDI